MVRLHFNKQGSAALAKNIIINHINCLKYLWWYWAVGRKHYNNFKRTPYKKHYSQVVNKPDLKGFSIMHLNIASLIKHISINLELI
jgi:hypothetical protein